MRFIVSKIPEHGRPYRVATISELPTELKEFHKFMQQRVCNRYGWGRYSIVRLQYYHESRGMKLIGVFRLTPEAVGMEKLGKHPVFPDMPSKIMWWETMPQIPRGIGIPVKIGPPTFGPKMIRTATIGNVPKKVTARRKNLASRNLILFMRGLNQ